MMVCPAGVPQPGQTACPSNFVPHTLQNAMVCSSFLLIFSFAISVPLRVTLSYTLFRPPFSGKVYTSVTFGVPRIKVYRPPPQVIHPTWRAADCRPYIKIVIDTVYLTYLVPVLRSKNVKNVVHYRRGGNLPPATYRLQPVRLNETTRYTEQCSGVDPTPSSPARGWHRGNYNLFG